MKTFHLFILSICIHIASFSQSKELTAFSKSYEFEYKKLYKNAIQELVQVYDENSYEINLRLGWLHYVNGELLKSKTYYNNAINLNTKSIEAKLGVLYPLAALQDWNEVITNYKEIISIDKYNYTANFQLATIYHNKKDFETAKKYTNQLKDKYPFDYNLNVLIGKINLGLGKITEAKESLLKAQLYSPTSYEAKNLLKIF